LAGEITEGATTLKVTFPLIEFTGVGWGIGLKLIGLTGANPLMG